MRIAVLGAGQQAHAIVFDILRNRKLDRLTVADVSHDAARDLVRHFNSPKLQAVCVDVTKPSALKKVLRDQDVAIGATTYAHNPALTKACITTQTHFCDLGGNNDVVAAQREQNAAAKKAGVTIVPDCGLAPGMMTLLAYHWAQAFKHVAELEIRVGGLPVKPKTALNYQLVFSVEGLINEYVEDAVILHNGRRKRVPSMADLESLAFGEKFPRLEAFTTSGGTSTLPTTLKGKVDNLNYKTIRYPGHMQLFRTFMDMGLCSGLPIDVGGQSVAPRRVFGRLLESYLPSNERDVVLMRVRLRGTMDGIRVGYTYDCIDYAKPKQGLTAMQRTTGFPVAIIAQMLADGSVDKRGVVPQEHAIDGDAFLKQLARRGIRFTQR